jgi:hypothetical protein
LVVVPTAFQYTGTLEGFNENESVVDEEAGRNEIDCIDVSSD